MYLDRFNPIIPQNPRRVNTLAAIDPARCAPGSLTAYSLPPKPPKHRNRRPLRRARHRHGLLQQARRGGLSHLAKDRPQAIALHPCRQGPLLRSRARAGPPRPGPHPQPTSPVGSGGRAFVESPVRSAGSLQRHLHELGVLLLVGSHAQPGSVTVHPSWKRKSVP